MKKLIKVKPMFNRIITTMNTYTEDQYIGGIIDTNKAKGSLKEYQTVVAVGTTIRDIKVGDVVCIDPTRYMVTKHNEGSLKGGIISDNMTIGYKFNTIELNGESCLMLYDQDITFIIEESEEVKDSTIVAPDKPNIIV